MQNRLYYKILAVFFIVVICVSEYSVWSKKMNPFNAVNILAYRDAREILPVFAQFTVTQTMQLQKPVVATKLVIPMYISQVALPIQISLLRNSKLIQTWQTPTDQKGIVELDFPLSTPVLLDGTLEVFFDGQKIEHQNQLLSPGLFVEKLDSAYPFGNYRIAQNEKLGDVSLKLVAQKTNQQTLREHIMQQPFLQIARLCLWVLLAVVILRLPFLVG